MSIRGRWSTAECGQTYLSLKTHCIKIQKGLNAKTKTVETLKTDSKFTTKHSKCEISTNIGTFQGEFLWF